MLLRLESGSPNVKAEQWDAALYLAASWDPYELIDRGVAAAAALSGGAQPRSAKHVPASLDGFGWCTWDAFYSTVSARGLAEGLASLAAGGIRPHLLIIDDGWQVRTWEQGRWERWVGGERWASVAEGAGWAHRRSCSGRQAALEGLCSVWCWQCVTW